jgi:lysophospholipase L1-like esterase
LTGIASAGALRVACIGNSITQGATLSNPGRDAYPALLDTLLGVDYEVNNYGVGGRVMLKNGDYPFWNEPAFTDALAFDPDIITIMLGTNDSKPWNWDYYQDEYVPDYIDMIRTFCALDNNPRFLLAYPPPAFSNLGSIRDSVIYHHIIPRIDSVAAATGTEIVDFYHAMMTDSDMFPDGIHPNVSGHEKIAEIYKAAIETLPAVIDSVSPWFTKVPVGLTTVYDSAAARIIVRTAGTAKVKYSASDVDFDAMEHTFVVTGSREHQTVIPGEHGKISTLYLRAMDSAGNRMDTSATISFTIDTTKVLYNWLESGYPDSSWKKGPAQFGNSQVSTKKTSLNDVRTAYFRKSISVADHTTIVGLGLLIKGQSGAIVYLNGHPIERINMPDDEVITYDSFAEEALTLNKMVVINSENGISYLKSGENMIVVEMHVCSGENAALAFDAQLFDNFNKLYFTLGSEWIYSDEGKRPEDQLITKVPDALTASPVVLPAGFELYQNYPNPFNPVTIIRYSLPTRSEVHLSVYDLTGACVCVLIDRQQESGLHTIEFSDAGLASGIYFCKLAASGNIKTIPMLLLK